MQDHRSAGELPESSANPSPAIGNVHGLGESHALRVDLHAVQVPWLADEVELLRGTVCEERAVARARPHQASASVGPTYAAGDEIDRRTHQLRVLGMIREQLPLTPPAVAASVSSVWEEHDDRAWEAAAITAPLTVVGPGPCTLVLIRGRPQRRRRAGRGVSPG